MGTSVAPLHELGADSINKAQCPNLDTTPLLLRWPDLTQTQVLDLNWKTMSSIKSPWANRIADALCYVLMLVLVLVSIDARLSEATRIVSAMYAVTLAA